tara:strand:+ start:205 stop:429 length:225 start_codon:yes stop_codon:yes gene_type:complete
MNPFYYNDMRRITLWQEIMKNIDRDYNLVRSLSGTITADGYWDTEEEDMDYEEPDDEEGVEAVVVVVVERGGRK